VLAQFIWAQACTGKFVWPVPDRGLKNRAHRIAAATLIVWGTADRIIAPAYAQEFATRIAGARVELIKQAGHLPHLEQPEAVSQAVRAFLSERG
jgi:pimeloyl-ACP methyl ester carboxylesterase